MERRPLTKDRIELMHKAMLDRIDDLYNIADFFDESDFTNIDDVGVSKDSIQLIRNKYSKEYKKILESEDYEKYKQVQELVYRNGGNISYLTKYDNEQEKELFIEKVWL